MNLKEWFSEIHRKSPERLSEKLARAFSSYVEAQPANTLLLPERALAAEIGVNRRTLCKAMEPLVREGLLERTRRGTVVRKERKEPDLDFEKIHPFVFGHTPKQKLKILLFENLPEQKRFWRETVEAFGEDVELEWLPLECRTTAALVNHIQKSGCDLAQVNQQDFCKYRNLAELFSALPEPILEYYEKPQYRFERFFSENPFPGKNLFPVYFQFQVLWLNRELTAECGFDITRFERGDFPLRELVRTAVRELKKPGVYLTPHFAALAESVRVERPLEPIRENLTEFFRNYYEVLADAAPNGSRLFSSSVYAPYRLFTPESFQFFKEGKLLFLPLFSVFANSFAGSVKIPFVETMIRPATRAQSFYAGLGIVKNSGKTAIAADFLLHLLSEPVQYRMAASLNVAPFLISADRELAERAKLPVKSITSFLNSFRPTHLELDLVRWELDRAEIDALLNERMTVENAVHSTVEKIMEYQTRKQLRED